MTRSMIAALGLTITTALAWTADAMAPLRWMVVALHEGGHVAMIALTGGRLVEISVSADGGLTRWEGGISWLVLSVGYMAPALVAMALMASRRGWWLGWLLVSATLRDIVEDAGQGDALLLAAWTGSAMVPSCAWGACATVVMALGWQNQNWK